MNLAAFRSRAARVSGMSTSDSGDTDLLDDWTNEAVEQFLKETKINIRTASLAVTADTGDYTLDTDILAMQALWYAPAANAQSALLQPLSPEAMIEMRLIADTAGDNPRYYAIAGSNTIMIHPEPLSSSDALHILYVPRHTTLSATSDTPSATANGNIPAEYHSVLESYVKWKACEAEEHKPSQNGLQFQAEWEKGIQKVKMEMKRKAGMVIPAARIGRPRTVPSGNGIDFR